MNRRLRWRHQRSRPRELPWGWRNGYTVMTVALLIQPLKPVPARNACSIRGKLAGWKPNSKKLLSET